MAGPLRAHLVAPQPLAAVVQADLSRDLAALTAHVTELEARVQRLEAARWWTRFVAWWHTQFSGRTPHGLS